LEADVTYGATGATTRLSISAGKDGAYLSVALAPQLSQIVVSPATVTTDDHGNATAFALVPYGTEGIVVASAVGATAVSIPMECAPVSLCGLTVQPETTVGSIGPTGQVCSVSVKALRTGPCEGGTPAPAGVSLTFAVIRPSGSDSTVSVATDSSGEASAKLLIPWGANILVRVAGGGSMESTLAFVGPDQPPDD
jgi:hypothetical protein